jgi:hypothetical protein
MSRTARQATTAFQIMYEICRHLDGNSITAATRTERSIFYVQKKE